MQPNSKVKIISINQENVRLCASAARISTTLGNAMQIYSDATDYSSNSLLVEKVLRSGHNSFIEHAVFTIAFSDVSVLVEQFIIEFRLASFTVKSRRYVDFGKMGYYTPEDITDDAKHLYQSHMDYLFSEYDYFISNGIPKEDARFVLPYSFKSNFYCTVNARELQHILKQIFGGRGAKCKELVNIGTQLYKQLEELFPYILTEVDVLRGINKNVNGSIIFPEISTEPTVSSSTVELVSLTDNTVEQSIRDYFKSDHGKELGTYSPRILELIHAAFIVRDISLSGLTHLARHRMQSIIIPPIWFVNPNRFIIPSSIREYDTLSERYFKVYARNVECITKLREYSFQNEAYLALSGNTLDVISSMNARELSLFIRLRSCTRAQWEIRNIVIDLLHKLRVRNAELFSKLGPNCFVNGHCPEGRLSCGKLYKEFSV